MNDDEKRDATRRLMHYDGENLGLKEMAFVLGMSRESLGMRKTRGTLPVLPQTLAQGPVWTRAQARQLIEVM